MRVLIVAKCPVDVFNAAVRDGSAGAKMKKILDEQKPEAVYFTELGGERTALIVVDMADASQIPSLSEPWFLQFNARLEIHPVMTPEDLAKSGLDGMGKKWG
jgi:hypothetical protein